MAERPIPLSPNRLPPPASPSAGHAHRKPASAINRSTVAAACGPPLGGLLVEASWRWVFLVNIPVGIAALLYARRLLGESVTRADRRIPDLAGTGVLIVSISLHLSRARRSAHVGMGLGADDRSDRCRADRSRGVFWRRCLTVPVPVVDPAFLQSARTPPRSRAMALYSTGVRGDVARRRPVSDDHLGRVRPHRRV